MTTRTRNGRTERWVMTSHGGRWVAEYPTRQQRVRCTTCHDTGQVVAGVADPDDPWSASTYEPCPRGCERSDR